MKMRMELPLEEGEKLIYFTACFSILLKTSFLLLHITLIISNRYLDRLSKVII